MNTHPIVTLTRLQIQALEEQLKMPSGGVARDAASDDAPSYAHNNVCYESPFDETAVGHAHNEVTFDFVPVTLEQAPSHDGLGVDIEYTSNGTTGTLGRETRY